MAPPTGEAAGYYGQLPDENSRGGYGPGPDEGSRGGYGPGPQMQYAQPPYPPPPPQQQPPPQMQMQMQKPPYDPNQPPPYGYQAPQPGAGPYTFDQAFKVEKPKWNDLWAGILVRRPPRAPCPLPPHSATCL